MLVLGGCGPADIAAVGAGPWPKYQELPETEFTETEKAVLSEFAEKYPELFKKIHGPFLYYREIVREHNKKALERDAKLLKTLGYKPERLKDISDNLNKKED